MMVISKARDEHDPYYSPEEQENGVMPSLSEAIIIAIAAIVALIALYEIHSSLDRVSQSIATSAITRGVPTETAQVSEAFRFESPAPRGEHHAASEVSTSAR